MSSFLKHQQVTDLLSSQLHLFFSPFIQSADENPTPKTDQTIEISVQWQGHWKECFLLVYLKHQPEAFLKVAKPVRECNSKPIVLL